MLAQFDEVIIHHYSPFSSRGGGKRKSCRRKTRKLRSKNRRTRKRYR